MFIRLIKHFNNIFIFFSISLYEHFICCKKKMGFRIFHYKIYIKKWQIGTFFKIRFTYFPLILLINLQYTEACLLLKIKSYCKYEKSLESMPSKETTFNFPHKRVFLTELFKTELKGMLKKNQLVSFLNWKWLAAESNIVKQHKGLHWEHRTFIRPESISLIQSIFLAT